MTHGIHRKRQSLTAQLVDTERRDKLMITGHVNEF
jgi:hypothetical protein